MHAFPLSPQARAAALVEMREAPTLDVLVVGGASDLGRSSS